MRRELEHFTTIIATNFMAALTIIPDANERHKPHSANYPVAGVRFKFVYRPKNYKFHCLKLSLQLTVDSRWHYSGTLKQGCVATYAGFAIR